MFVRVSTCQFPSNYRGEAGRPRESPPPRRLDLPRKGKRSLDYKCLFAALPYETPVIAFAKGGTERPTSHTGELPVQARHARAEMLTIYLCAKAGVIRMRVHSRVGRLLGPRSCAAASGLGGAGCGAGFTSAPGAIFIA